MTSYFQMLSLTICTSVLMIASLWLLVGPLGQFPLCHAGICATGAYASSLFSMAMLQRYPCHIPPFQGTVCMFIAVLIGGLFGGIAGLLAGLPAAKLKKEHITLATLAFGEILRSIIINTPFLGGQGFKNGSAGQSLIGIPPLLSFGFTWIVTLLSLLFLLYLYRAPFCRACRAVRDDEAAAKSIGLFPHRIKILAFFLSGMIAGVSGSLFAHGIGTLSPTGFSYVKSTEYAMLCVPAGDSLALSVGMGLVGALLPVLLAPLGKHRMVLYPLGILLFILYQAKKRKHHEKSNHSQRTKPKC